MSAELVLVRVTADYNWAITWANVDQIPLRSIKDVYYKSLAPFTQLLYLSQLWDRGVDVFTKIT